MTILVVVVLAAAVGLRLLWWLPSRHLRGKTIALAKEYEARGGDVEVAFLREVAKTQQETRRGRRWLSRVRARRAARVLAQIRRDRETRGDRP